MIETRMNNPMNDDYELAVIGGGIAGMAASLFAANRGIRTLQCAGSSSLAFSTGLFDLMGVYPAKSPHFIENPWEAIAKIKKTNPNHPYAKIPPDSIQQAFNELVKCMEDTNSRYFSTLNNNSTLLTSLGTLKPSYYIPQNMWNSVLALEEKGPCLLVGINNLREFSARQIVETQKKAWSGLRYELIDFPGLEDHVDIQAERLAMALEVKQTRMDFAAIIKPLLRDEKYLGLPPILGIHRFPAIFNDLEELLGTKVFEISTPTVSVPGLRLMEIFKQNLPELNVNQIWNSRVETVEAIDGDRFQIRVKNQTRQHHFTVRAIILATGRFFGGGLEASRSGLRETVLDLPVVYPPDREDWHNREFLSPHGHAINRAGLEVDGFFRPLNKQGTPYHKNLFAIGSILAHQDWKREKSGTGISISTALAAVKSYLNIN